MKLLVTTPTLLLHVDTTTSKSQRVESHRPGYYGITWDLAGKTLMLSHGGTAKPKPSRSGSFHAAGWISAERGRSPSILSNSHQLLAIDDRIVATNTGQSCLTVFRTDDWFYRHYSTNDARGFCYDDNDPEDRQFNSIFYQKDQLYAVANTRRGHSEIIRFFWPEMEVIEVSKTNVSLAHNIWVSEAGQPIICDSTQGKIIDADNGNVLWASAVKSCFVRGIATDGAALVVGQSPGPSGGKEDDRTSSLAIIDCETWKTLETIQLPDAECIHDIRILDRPDLCHHGAIFRRPLESRQTANVETMGSYLLDESHRSLPHLRAATSNQN